MNIVVFGPDRRTGVLAGQEIVDLNLTDAQLPPRLLDLIELGNAGRDRIRAAVARENAVKVPAKEVTLQAPWAGRRIACAGGNFGDHLLGMDINVRGMKDSSVEKAIARTRAGGNWGFWKVPVDVAGPEDGIPYPARTSYFDYEAEIAIVIGKRGKDIKADRVAEYVWGVTLINDVSIRDGEVQPRGLSFNLWKNFDMSTAIGPTIFGGDIDPQNIDVETRVNGELRQHFNTSGMIFSFAETLEFLSRDFTFVPGDMISGGTAAGTAADSSRVLPDGTQAKKRFLKRGDIIEMSSPPIGLLRNRVV